MSQENVEVVRALFNAFNRQDGNAVRGLWTADAVWRPAYIGGGLPEGAAFRGHEGMAEFVELQAKTWESVVAEPADTRDLGNTVVVEVHLSAVGRDSGVPVERVTWNVFELRDGKIATGTVYTCEQQALKAVGLEEAMSDNLDLVRSILADWEGGDWSSADWADPDIEFELTGIAGGRWTGLIGMAEGFGGWLGGWDDFRIAEVEAFRELDHERVLVLHRFTARGKSSGLAIEQTGPKGASLFHIRDGKVIRVVAIVPPREQALAHLGLAE